MESIELYIRKEFSPALFGGENVDDDMQELLVHGVKRGWVGFPDPKKSA